MSEGFGHAAVGTPGEPAAAAPELPVAPALPPESPASSGEVPLEPSSPSGEVPLVPPSPSGEPPPAPPPLPGELLPRPAQAQSPGRHALGGRRLAVFALTLALASALAGGLVGGYVVSRTSGDGVSPGFSLGTVPGALTDRPPASVAGIAARVLPSVVMIRVDGSEGTGSGFIIRGGYVITDNHVVTLDGRLQHASLQVVFNSGRTVPAKLIGTDPFSDIAVIRPRVTGRLPALSLGNSAGVQVG